MNDRDRDRYRRNPPSQFGETPSPSQGYGQRQPQQWQTDVRQQIGGAELEDSRFERSYGDSQRPYDSDLQRERYAERQQRDTLRPGPRTHGHTEYDNRYEDNFASFTGNDYGGRDFVQRGGTPYGAAPLAYRSGEYEERGLLERAGDHIAKWFGDEDAARRIEQDHRGRGPTGYTRSDARVLEDVCDRLTDDYQVDASNITVSVEQGEVTLNGTVDTRLAKRRAEDCAEAISGVKHVQNNLRVQAADIV